MIHFDPPLSCSITLAVPPTLILGSRLQLHATLAREEYARLCQDGTKVQVWSDVSGVGEWSDTSFEETTAVNLPDEHVDLSLMEPANSSKNPEDKAELVATTSLPPLVGRVVHFTYRMVHQSGSVTWLGSEGTNGSISVEKSEAEGHLGANDWSEDEHGVFSWRASAGKDSLVVAKLGSDADWRGWAIGKEGPSRFTALSSAVAERVVLALLPKARPGAYILYAPVLYHTTAGATLSLTDNREILFHTEDEESMLHASISTVTWKDCIGDDARALDIRTADFLGVSVQNGSMGRIYFLPVSGTQAIVTLKFADVQSLVLPSTTVVFINPKSSTPMFLTSSPDHNTRVAVGDTGGELLVLPGYSLQSNGDEWSMAFLPLGSGNVIPAPLEKNHGFHTEEPSSTSEHNLSESAPDEQIIQDGTDVEVRPNRHSLDTETLLFIMVHFFRILLELVGSSVSSAASPATFKMQVDEQTHLLTDAQKQQTAETETLSEPATALPATRFVFEITGKNTLVVKGEDISKILILVDGIPLKTTPKDIGGECWLFESDAGPDRAKLEVAVHE